MSERSDKKNELLKQNLQDSTYLYDTEKDINNFNDILKYLLGSSVIYNDNTIAATTDWNTLESNSAYVVNSYSGKNAPSATKFVDNTGFVFVLSNYQIALNNHEIAFRPSNGTWQYLELPMPKSVSDYINNNVIPQIKANKQQVSSLATDAAQDHASLAAQATSLSNELNSIDINSGDINKAEQFIKANGASISNVNSFANSNKGNIQSLSSTDTSLSGDISNNTSSLESAKADKTSVADDVKNFNATLTSLSTSAKNAHVANSTATSSLSTSTSTDAQSLADHFHGLTFGDIKPSNNTNK